MTKLLVLLSILLTVSPVKAETASWYGPGFQGKRTASGERFNRYSYTAAHRSLPFGTHLVVCYRGRCVTVRVNDRGPFRKGRSLDLSEAAAKKIHCKAVCRVTVKVVKQRRLQ